jgi:hypothetical protein
LDRDWPAKAALRGKKNAASGCQATCGIDWFKVESLPGAWATMAL